MTQPRDFSRTAVVMQGLPEFSAQTRLLVVAPHPDDETIATGLLIQRVLEAGGEVRVLLLTGGDNNPWPQRWLERRIFIGASARKRWGARRHGEMLQALQRLGLRDSSLQSLGWPDMAVTDRLLRKAHESVSTLAAAIGQFSPSLVVAPALSDDHPDHGAAHVLVRLAIAGMDEPLPLLTYLVHGHDGDGRGFEVVGSTAQLACKLAALDEHRSQMALSGKRMRHLAGRPEICAWPAKALAALPWRPAACLLPWLRISVVSPAGVTSWRWGEAPLRRDPTGAWQLLPSNQPSCGPVFVRLALILPTPWIFDHWGWCELAIADTSLLPALALTEGPG
ncbi:N-acetyl-1-D-myo-inositol-2-amino-2-deoxy-alpha-D-glucopyranoside deacetylase [Rhodanobacter sp. TND4EL1]